MLHVVGRLMSEAHHYVKVIVMDAHCSHAWIREAIFGEFRGLSPEVLKDIPFFRDISYVDLPRHNLPKLDVKVAMHNDSAVWLLPGVCDFFHICGEFFLIVFICF